jgi:hypothetical protein
LGYIKKIKTIFFKTLALVELIKKKETKTFRFVKEFEKEQFLRISAIFTFVFEGVINNE